MSDDLAVLGLENLAAEMQRPASTGFGGAKPSVRMQMALRGKQLGMIDQHSGFVSAIQKRADAARARAARDTAVHQLTGLDVSDPGYYDKSQAVIRQNPDAIMDPAVKALLGYQDSIADFHESGRRWKQQQDRLTTNRQNDLKLRQAQAMEANQADLAEAVSSLPQQKQDKFMAMYYQALSQGKSPKVALAESAGSMKYALEIEDRELEARERFSPEAVERLQRAGFTDDAVGQEVSREVQADRQEQDRKDRLSELDDNIKRLEEMLPSGYKDYPEGVPEDKRWVLDKLTELRNQDLEMRGLKEPSGGAEGPTGPTGLAPELEKTKRSLFFRNPG